MCKQVFFGLCFALYAVSGIHAETIAAGTTIDVRTNDVIDARDAGNGRVYSGQVDRDVFDRDNGVAIPRGTDVELIVRDIGHHTLALDLDGVVVNGKRYSVTTYDVTRDGEQKDGVGANRRTGKFVGGGALFGTILGAVAGGGKGAAIGAAVGGGAGTGVQVFTHGQQVKIPSETRLDFTLQQPLEITYLPGKRSRQHSTADQPADSGSQAPPR